MDAMPDPINRFAPFAHIVCSAAHASAFGGTENTECERADSIQALERFGESAAAAADVVNVHGWREGGEAEFQARKK